MLVPELIVRVMNFYKDTNQELYELFKTILFVNDAFVRIECTPLKTEDKILDNSRDFYEQAMKDLRTGFSLLMNNNTFKTEIGYYRFNRLRKIYNFIEDTDLSPELAYVLKEKFNKILKNWVLNFFS